MAFLETAELKVPRQRARLRGLAQCWLVSVGLLSLLTADEWSDAEKAFQEKHTEEAKARFERLANEQPQDRRGPYFLGLVAKRLKNADETLSLAKRSVELDPKWSDAWILLGEAYGMKAKRASLFEKLDWAIKCREAFEKALALDPKSPDAHEALVQFCYEAPEIAGGGEERAERELRAFYDLDFVAAAVYEIPRLLKRNQYERVLDLCEQGLKRDPQSYELTWYFGYTASLSHTHTAEGLARLESLAGRPTPPDMPPSSEIDFRKSELRRQLSAPTP